MTTNNLRMDKEPTPKTLCMLNTFWTIEEQCNLNNVKTYIFTKGEGNYITLYVKRQQC